MQKERFVYEEVFESQLSSRNFNVLPIAGLQLARNVIIRPELVRGV